MDWKSDKNGSYFIKHSNFRIESTPVASFEEMVTITKGPSFGRGLIGKRYISLAKAIGAVDIVCGEKLIGKGLNQAVAEMADLGLVSAEEFTASAGNVIVEPHYAFNNELV
jgi:hypothetical protein